jgi:acetyltransferase-like isoleucine patch superfamily enzyme
MKRLLKIVIGTPLQSFLRIMRPVRENLRRLQAHAMFAADINTALPSSAIIEGKVDVYGTRNIHIGEDVFFFPAVHLETREEASIWIADGVVLSRGVHIVAFSGVTIGRGSMIGEYSSIRDANHNRSEEITIRDAGHTARAIAIGAEVWIGRGVTVLGGITIGDKATIGANAVVTRDVPAGAIVAGVPAVPIASRRNSPTNMPVS